jgi:phage terminase small subunit
MIMTRLTPKQQLFCDEYLIDLNATQAAIRAGYSVKTSKQIGDENLSKPDIKAYLQKRMNDRQKRTEIIQDYVLETIRDTVERCRQARPVLNRNGDPVLVETPSGKLVPAYVFDPANVLKGCELIGKHLGMFKDNVKHQFTDENGDPITGINITVRSVAPGEVKH